MKSNSTKSQYYRYTLRPVAVVAGTFCTDKIYLYPVPPQDALEIVGLFTHFRMVFNSSVASANRVVEYIGVTNERPLSYLDEASLIRKFDLNQAADGNRRVDIKLDLTSLLTPENVGFTPLLSADYTTEDQTFIIVKVPDSLRDTLNVGTIELWKADAVYTTQEIR